MKALTIKAYNNNLIRAMQGMEIIEKEKQKPASGEVLIKVELAPVNPSDIAFLRGGYNIMKPLPAVAGFEGTGTITETGPGIDQSLKGKRVSFFSQSDQGGAWAEYTIAGQSDFILVDEDVPPAQAACMFVNPLTAKGMFEHVLNNGHKALIQSAAMGQVGRFIRFFAAQQNIPVINLVRKDKHLEELTAAGERFVLNINSEDFPDALQRMSADIQATAVLDAVGGELTGKLLNAAPAGSEVILYGGLSGTPVSGLSTLDIIFSNKVLWGFNLNDWLSEMDAGAMVDIGKSISAIIAKKEMETTIRQVYPLENFYDAIRSYISDMSAGKVLLSM